MTQATETKPIPHCCKMNCTDKATFHVQDLGEGKNFESYTHCCEAHLPEMINGFHEVWRLEKQEQ